MLPTDLSHINPFFVYHTVEVSSQSRIEKVVMLVPNCIFKHLCHPGHFHLFHSPEKDLAMDNVIVIIIYLYKVTFFS